MKMNPSIFSPRFCIALISTGFVLWASGCVGPTPYQPANTGNGYSEQQLSDNKQVVSFGGNALTSKKAVEEGLLRRAAEVTLKKGYDYFIIEDQVIDKSTANIKLPQRGIGGVEAFPGLGIPPTGAVESYYPMDAYTMTATISLHRGVLPADNKQAYDARKFGPPHTDNRVSSPPTH